MCIYIIFHVYHQLSTYKNVSKYHVSTCMASVCVAFSPGNIGVLSIYIFGWGEILASEITVKWGKMVVYKINSQRATESFP